MNGADLERLGFGPYFSAQVELFGSEQPLAPARVSADSGSLVELAGCAARLGELSGRLKKTLTRSTRPTTGDWVLVDTSPVKTAEDHGIIHRVLDRRTELRRRAAGSDGLAQVVAANVDVFFIVTSANRDLNERRLERYLTAVWNSGARPVVVVNKVDLVDDIDGLLTPLGAVALGVDVVGVSALEGTGIDALASHVGNGKTVGFIGSSGVGKSSLINRLLAEETHLTNATRSDDKGRHTTTRRELVVLPHGGVLIDTPGMREFGVLSDGGGLDSTFADIAEFAADCQFQDCRHEGEPGCAVLAAVEGGELSEERLASYRRLLREIAANERRQDPVLGANAKRRWKSIHKQMRSLYRAKGQSDD